MAVMAAAGFTAWLAASGRRKYPVAGKVALITGGSRGLGLALAETFGRAGARLVLTARNEAELERARALLVERGAARSAEHITLLPCDLTDADAVEHMVASATLLLGRIDLLINNAGIISVGPVENQPQEAFREAMEVNYFGTLHATMAVLPQMLSRARRQAERQAAGQGRPTGPRTNSGVDPGVDPAASPEAEPGTIPGAIVNIASIGGKVAVPHMLPYSASKFAIVGWSQGLHAELRSKGIRVTTVSPGLMRTGSPGKALFVGNREEEFRWFHLGASLPLVSCSAGHAARRILRAVETGEGELSITPQAALAARLAQLAPACTAELLSLANRFLLPAPVPRNDLPLPGELVSEKALRPLTGAGDRAASTWNQ